MAQQLRIIWLVTQVSEVDLGARVHSEEPAGAGMREGRFPPASALPRPKENPLRLATNPGLRPSTLVSSSQRFWSPAPTHLSSSSAPKDASWPAIQVPDLSYVGALLGAEAWRWRGVLWGPLALPRHSL